LTVFTAFSHLLTTPIRWGPRPSSLFKDVAYAAFRTFLGNISIASEKYLDAGSDATYLEFARKRGFQPDTLVLADGTKAHWLGPRQADKVIIFFHGKDP